MKAVRFHSYGGDLVYEEVEQPVAGPGDVVLRVAGSAANYLDVAIRRGQMQEVMPVTLPHIPNYDVSGVVTSAGDGVSWQVGDAVVGFLPPTSPGAAAEYVTAPAEVLAAAPSSVDLTDAAALPSVG